jgi:hypothetical protein
MSNSLFWPTDATMTEVTVTNEASLSSIRSIWPKLWRRLEEYFPTHQDLDDFMAWLEARGERVDILPTLDQKGL